jgi:hypothetical protein
MTMSGRAKVWLWAPKSAFRLVQLAADSCSFSKPQLHGFKLFAHTAASKAVDLFEKF